MFNKKITHENIIKLFVHLFCVITVGLIVTALFVAPSSGEATIGDFSGAPFNTGWVAEINGVEQEITLPTRLDCKPGDVISLRNSLPPVVVNGSTLMLRTTMEDAYIYIGGVLRTCYASSNFESMIYHLPSEYLVANLLAFDSKKDIEVRIRVKENPILSEITINPGNNGWFSVISDNLLLTVLAFFDVIIGFAVMVLYIVFHKKLNVTEAILYLGLLMIMLGFWLISESRLRQLIFNRPSMSTYFSYMGVEILGALVTIYIDYIQGKRFHKEYTVFETLICTQIIVNLTLQFTGVAELYSTLIFSHFWIIIGIIAILINIIRDIKNKFIKNYKIVAYGMALFMLMGFVELLNFYFNPQNSMGIYLCAGLMILMFATIIQAVFDVARKNDEQDEERQEAWIETIETIASAIDAKDEYTGGHSNRVGAYVGILAREMAKDYGFSEADLIRIQYIGLMHDIGKIGVADPVLNKVGRLTDEEFTLMKKHVEIGADLLHSIGKSTEGLLDGIRYHHERYDGKGYPEGLKGEEIPLIARMLCLADCYDAMTSNRVYRNRLSDEEVRNEIANCSGRQFDPALTEIFVRLIDRGDIRPFTLEGLATKADGTVLASARLEQMMQTDISQNKLSVLNPTHVRMVCYIIKLAEQNNKSFALFRIESGNDAAPQSSQELEKNIFEENMKSKLRTRDVCVAYTDTIHIVALFDRTEEEIAAFTKSFGKNETIIPIK